MLISKELQQYIYGRNDRPYFSIAISSHMMLGLSVLYKKKIIYLHGNLNF